MDGQHAETGGADHDGHGPTAKPDHSAHTKGRHEGHSTADFRRRFWISLALTVPVIALSPALPFYAASRIIDTAGADWILLGIS